MWFARWKTCWAMLIDGILGVLSLGRWSERFWARSLMKQFDSAQSPWMQEIREIRGKKS